MKFNLRTFLFAAVAGLAVGFTSCSDDDFTDTIFNSDPRQDYLDKTQYTFPLDTFIKKEFLEPYNVKFTYKFDDKGSDKNKNLTPASYDKCVDLAVLTKFMWYDVYKKLAGVEFLKKFSPRVINLTGSKNYNPSSGTETLGDASSGVKINLYNVNNLDVNDIEMLNEYSFKTMHHEFAHILDQTILRPTTFNTISSSGYDASGWSDAADSLKAGAGFVTPYASSSVTEDWAESLANYITMDSLKWEEKLASASYEWEEIDCDSKADYNKRLSPGCDLDTIGYFKETKSGVNNKIYRRKCLRNSDGTVALDEQGKPQWVHDTGVDGRSVILRKVDLVRTYLKENFNIDLDELRKTVQELTYVTDENGKFVLNQYNELINRLTSIQPSGKTLMDELRDEVYKYKALQSE